MEASETNTSTSSTSLAGSCSNERYWFAFLFSSLATFLIGVMAILLWRCCALIYKRGPTMRYRNRRLLSTVDKQQQEKTESFDAINERNWATIIKEYAAKLITGQKTPGKILVSDAGKRTIDGCPSLGHRGGDFEFSVVSDLFLRCQHTVS